MASNHYRVKKKINIVLNLEVEVDTIHNYHSLDEEGFERVYDEIRVDLKEDVIAILNQKLGDHDNMVTTDRVTLKFKETPND